MVSLADIKPKEGSKHKKKREGRGHAGYGGKTAGKGMNGQKARRNPGVRVQFEGGQTPMYRRLPKKQYIPAFNKVSYSILNIDDLQRIAENFPDVDTVDVQFLKDNGIVKQLENGGLKILGRHKTPLKKKLTVKAHSFSETAKQQIAAAGGVAETIAL